ncbi:MAG TPA: hypothetical protein VH877_06640 [Polyangia bacterium]|jgi:hypothetical protein|nr:hypothetical protein [Polyangia bacterium]
MKTCIAALVLAMFTSTCNKPPTGASDMSSVGDGAVALRRCDRTDPSCPEGEVCALSEGGFNDHEPTCLQRCQTTRDCPSGMRCAVLYSEFIDPVCVSDSVPARRSDAPYDPQWHCDFPPSYCKDASTEARPFSEPLNRTCGHELIFCVNGCQTVDEGGIRVGRCNPSG